MKKGHSYSFILLLLAVLTSLTACNPSKRLAEGEYLLHKNTLTVDGGPVDSYEATSIYKQNANKRLLKGPRFFLGIYNSVNPEKAQRKIIKQQIKINKKNMKRMSKGKDSLEYSPTWREWMMFTLGEPPVVLDTAKVSKTRKQLDLYLHKKGFFDGDVTREMSQDTLTFVRKDSMSRKEQRAYDKKIKTAAKHQKKQLAQVSYHLETDSVWKIEQFVFNSEDKTLERKINEYLWKKGKGGPLWQGNIGVGDNFDMYELDELRDKIAKNLQDEAYWKFIKEYITFNADTSIKDHAITLTMSVKPWQEPDPLNPDSLIERDHRIYKIAKATFILDYDPTDPAEAGMMRKEIVHNGPDGYPHYFQFKDTLNIDPDLLINSNFLRPTKDGFCKAKYISRTYKRLTELGVYRTVNISIEESDYNRREARGYVNITFYLTPAKQKSLSIEGRGVHNSGFMGVEGSISHNNKNAFGGAENITFSFTGGFEAQQTLTGAVTDTTETGEPVQNTGLSTSSFLNALNTLEIGPEIKLKVPSVLVIPKKRRFSLSRSAMPFTEISTGFNFQKRPDYIRSLFHLEHSIIIKETKTKAHTFTFPAFSYVTIKLDSLFELALDESNDDFIRNSYQDHLTFGVAYNFTFDSHLKPENLYKNFQYIISADGEVATDAFFFDPNLSNLAAEFYRVEGTLRFFQKFNKRHGLAGRVSAGFGLPYDQNKVLPFEKSFFSGGANTLRAWKARAVGPGKFFDPNLRFDKIGNVKLESNLEYRFDFVSMLEMALFVDAGNIWLEEPDALRPGGHFEFKDFYNELAVGGGVGARLDFAFFIIRVDMAVPLRDPSLPNNERWIWQDKTTYKTWPEHPYRYPLNMNIGIGYPF